MTRPTPERGGEAIDGAVDSGNRAFPLAGHLFEPGGRRDGFRRGDRSDPSAGARAGADVAEKRKGEKAEKRKASQEERGKAQKGDAEDHGSGDPAGAAGAMGHCEKGAKDDLSAHPYFTYGDFGGYRWGGPGGHGHSLRKAQRRHVDGDAGTYGAGADAGCAHTPGAGPAGRRDEGAGQSGCYGPDMGSDSHGLCLRHTAYQMVFTVEKTAAACGKGYRQPAKKG